MCTWGINCVLEIPLNFLILFYSFQWSYQITVADNKKNCKRIIEDPWGFQEKGKIDFLIEQFCSGIFYLEIEHIWKEMESHKVYMCFNEISSSLYFLLHLGNYFLTFTSNILLQGILLYLSHCMYLLWMDGIFCRANNN